MIRFLLLFTLSCLSCVSQHAVDTLSSNSQQPFFEKVTTIKETISTKDITTVEVHNLVGAIFIENGESFEIDGEVHVISTRETVAENASKKPKLISSTKDKTVRVHMSYPLDEYSVFYYPGVQKRSKGKSSESRLIIPYEGKEVAFVSMPSSDAIELSTNLHIKVPKGVQLIINNKVGSVHSKGFSGSLHVDTVQASILIEKGEGPLLLTSATGPVSVNSHEGEEIAKTGTGAIRFSKCSGLVEAMSGSGAISTSSCMYDKCLVETGAGRIRISKTKANLEISSGSGSVHCKDIVAQDNLVIKTGSGKITASGNLSQAKNIDLESGSGDILLTSKPFPRLDIEASTGSGSIMIAIGDITLDKKNPRKVKGSFSNKDAKSVAGAITIQTGSGDITVNNSSN